MSKGYLGTYGARKCKICKGNIEIVNGYRDGHNAQPVARGSCCGDCSATGVMKAGFEQVQEQLA